MAIWDRMLDVIDREGAVALVSVVAAAGSVPREAGARLVLTPSGGFWGTVGGGALEWTLVQEAGEALSAVDPVRAEGRGMLRDRPLGPELGQCCGGRVTALVETYGKGARSVVAALASAEAHGGFDSQVALDPDGTVRRVILPTGAAPQPGSHREHFGDERTPLLLFGAGHVGRALVVALAPLPFAVRWVDSRAEAFPAHLPANATAICPAEPESEVRAASAGSLVLIMTHSHPLDLAITAAALSRDDLPFVGLIGSANKKARFLSRIRAAGHSDSSLGRLVCPIGVQGLGGKEPAIIAASVAVQLLQVRLGLAHRSHPNEAGAAPSALRRAGGRS
jgi:xanthine dehydrogenase accessory factor